MSPYFPFFLKRSNSVSRIFLLLLLPTILKAAPPKAPDNLRSYDKAAPVGTDAKPFFGWYVNDPDDNEIQTGYQILVASSQKNLDANKGDLWDSGKVSSGKQNYVYYEGKPLAPSTRYYWKVRSWDKEGNASPYSTAAHFDTGLFTNEDWSGAKWIRREKPDADDYTYFRKKVKLPNKKIKRATAYVAASHNYELYLNGDLVGKGIAYHYPQYAYYNAFDITEELKTNADNAFAALTHWYGGGQGRPKGEPGFLMKAVIEYNDGSSTTIGTDSSWKQKQATAWRTDKPERRNGEGVGYIDKIDARNIIPNWHTLTFNDSNWKAATEIGPQPTAPWTGTLQPDLTRLQEKEITPVAVKDLGNGTFMVDLGKVYAGVPKITFTGGTAGDTVKMMGGYTLKEDGTVNTRTNQSTNMSYNFILDGKTAVFQPMVYLGMRYLQVDNSPTALTPSNVKFIQRHYELDPARSSFSSSNPMLNQVWDLMKRSLVVGAHEQFVDTPTREKGGFLGDSWSQGVPAMTTFGDRNMNDRILDEFLDSQDQYWPDGRMNAVYPNADGKRDIPDYTQSYLVWAWDYYQQTGNIDFLRDNYPRLKKIAEYVDSYKNEATGLIHNLAGGSGPYQYGIIDWPATMRYGYDMDTEARTVINAYAYIDYDIISKIAAELGKTRDKDLYASKAEAMKKAINAQLINNEGVYIDGLTSGKTQSAHVSQHSNAYPLAMGIVPEANYEKVLQAIKDRKMSVGMVSLRWLPEAIGQAGQGPHLLELYTNPEWDGWAQTIKKGGTATWESWDADQTRQSMSHPWGAAGLLGIQQYILGIQPLKPQHEKVMIKPLDFKQQLSNAKGTLPTDRGDISVDWNRTDSDFTMVVEMPDNVTAKVYVPKSGTSGNTLKINGKEIKGTEEGEYVFVDNIGSGKHTFSRAAAKQK